MSNIQTLLIHSDRNESDCEVSPPISVSSTFKRPKDGGVPSLIYSRINQPITIKVEKVISTLEKGFATVYTSGMAAIMAALIFFNPTRVAIRGGYYGSHELVEMFLNLKGTEKKV
jgi:cystathionine gamma-synthase